MQAVRRRGAREIATREQIARAEDTQSGAGYSGVRSVLREAVEVCPLATNDGVCTADGHRAEMRRAIEIAQQGLTDTLPHIKAGMKESDVAALLVDHMTKRGSQGVAFEPLIQTGLSATNPHGHAGERVLQMGDLIVIDWGCRYGNYQSDITRTLAIGLISVELRTLYETVKAANAAGRAAIKPGVTCEAVDRAARGVIEAAGYGEWFTHRTGHGLGLEGHEPPYMVAGETMSLRAGMTFTIEPGLYVPGVGGVRIEDDVIVTETGGESLTSFERELITVDSINQ